MTCSNGSGVENSLLIRHLFELQPEAINLYNFLNIFLPRYDLDLSGYLLKMFVVFFLQNEKLLPSIEDVQNNLKIKKIGGKYETCLWEI